MTEEIISVRINRETKERMKDLDFINWSAILRKAITNELEKVNYENFDAKRAKKAAKNAEKIRKARIFDTGKTGTKIIREWRDKKRF